jgi:hypothetical protein
MRVRLEGSIAKNQTSSEKGRTRHDSRTFLKKNVQKDLGGVKILHQGLGGYTRRVRSRAPTEKSYDDMTPVHELLSL